MARALATRRSVDVVSEHEKVVDYYREALARKPDIPDYIYPPSYIGPTWQLTPNGYWLLPEHTLGWDVIGWCGVWLQLSKGVPWRFTLEQARFLLWFYAVNGAGDFVYKDAVLQRVKGWGKDPIGACYLAVELLGPCRFLEWDRGEPVARDVPNAWVQTCAVALGQTKNTMRLFPGLFTAAAKAEFDLLIGQTHVYALESSRFIQAHTSSPSTMEGARATAVLMNETHLWLESNQGGEMAGVIRRNAAKAPDAGARTLRITNAFEPGRDSVAEADRGLYEKVLAGEAENVGLLYDSIEAAAAAPLTAEAAPLVAETIRGDSTWLSVRSMVSEILDIRIPPSTNRRYWYNQITAAEEAWITPQQWDACERRDLELAPGDQIVEFFDGSKTYDATALVACRISDGAVFFRGVWQRPPNAPGWQVPRDQVDDLVRRDHERYDVVAFFGDPGAGDDDADGQRYWDAYLDAWSRDLGGDGPSPDVGSYCIWPLASGPNRHAVIWDMRSSEHVKMFTEACERTNADIEERILVHDGNRRLRAHVLNCRRRPNNYGVSVGKESRNSSNKIDLGVCAIGARMLWRIYQGLPEDKKRRNDGPSIYEERGFTVL